MDTQTLTQLRKTIDDLDAQLVELLNKRAKTAVAIGAAKAKLQKLTYDPARERDVLYNIDTLNHGPLPNGSLEDIYATIITACREIQVS